MKTIRNKRSSDVVVKDSAGDIVDIYYGPDQGANIVQTYYWANDLQGRLKQELGPPRPYHNRIPIPYVKEDIERTPNGTVVSHFRYYHGVKPSGSPILKAYETMEQPEYIRSVDGYLTNEGLRYEAKRFVHNWINNGGWVQFKVSDETEERKSKKHKVSAIRKKSKSPIKKKVVLKKKPKQAVKKRK